MGVALGVALGFLGLLLVVRLAMGRIVPFFVFYPEPLAPQESHPRFWGFPDATEVRIPTVDGPLLHGWWFPAAGSESSSGTAIYFHGNAGHLGDRGTIAAALSGLGLDVLLADYRGFGLSEGKPSEEGLYADAEAMYHWLVEERGADPRKLFLLGNSLGSAVAVYLASRRPVAGIVLLGAFTHTPAIARHRLSWLPGWYLDWNVARFDSLARLPEVRAPILVGAGSEDAVIPPDEARKVYEAAPQPKRWLLAEGAGHNDIFAHEGLWRELYRFTHDALVGELSGRR
ncbi:MAG: alpha/beta fold hydrolase [Gemmatimonadota bacterium]|nr:alpha/beta fold hydrolase [Gemmatimonadota bacterium]